MEPFAWTWVPPLGAFSVDPRLRLRDSTVPMHTVPMRAFGALFRAVWCLVAIEPHSLTFQNSSRAIDVTCEGPEGGTWHGI